MGQKDIAEKILEAYNDVFSDIVNVLLFNGDQILKENELEDQAPRSAYKADGKYREIERDVAKRWKNKNIRLACIGLENQTEPDADMPLRIMGYDGAEYRAQLNNENQRERYPVITLVLYYGYPAVTISRGKVRFNTACMKRFEDVEYVELLFNSVEKCLAVRPCDKSCPNAIRWGTLQEGKWIVREKSCRGFSAPLYEIMGWNEELRYRMRGSFLGEGDDRIMIFDLDEPEIIERVLIEDIPTEPDELATIAEETMVSDANAEASKPKYKSVTTFPCGGVFGCSYDEDTRFLERVHYSGNWDVLRPAREVFGVNPITEEEIDALLHEAERIIDKLRTIA